MNSAWALAATREAWPSDSRANHECDSGRRGRDRGVRPCPDPCSTHVPAAGNYFFEIVTLRTVRRPRANCRSDLCRLLVCRADSCRHLPRTCAARLVCPNPCFRASDAWRRHVIIYVFMCMFLTLMAVLAGYGFITQRKREFPAPVPQLGITVYAMLSLQFRTAGKITCVRQPLLPPK